MAENPDSRQLFEVSNMLDSDTHDPCWLPQDISENDSFCPVSSIAIKNEPIYHYIMDGAGGTGQYLPVVTIGADGQLRAVTDPSILTNQSNVQSVDVGEEVIVFPDKTTQSEALPEGIVEIDVDAGDEEISSEAISIDQQNQLPIVTTFLAPNKNVTIGGIQYIQAKTNKTSTKILPASSTSSNVSGAGNPTLRKAKFQCKVFLLC
ncbi:hypothetical protein FOCC_FOCC000652 [Frankliniella occidentalis]|nr:hypothetical protein FOCC_FOCC000652 [Frankliniella occidentalis]